MPVARVYELEQIAQAHDMEAGNAAGKLVVTTATTTNRPTQ